MELRPNSCNEAGILSSLGRQRFRKPQKLIKKSLGMFSKSLIRRSSVRIEQLLYAGGKQWCWNWYSSQMKEHLP